MKYNWENVPGKFITNVDSEDDHLFDDEGNPFPKEILPLIQDGDAIVIEFLSTGYESPVSMYGGHDYEGSPAEQGEERKLVKAIVEKQNNVLMLDRALSEILFEHYKSEIAKVEIDPQ